MTKEDILNIALYLLIVGLVEYRYSKEEVTVRQRSISLLITSVILTVMTLAI